MMFSRNTPARLDPDSEPAAPATSTPPNVSPRTAANLRKSTPGTQQKAGFALFSGSARKASLTAPASKTGAKLPGRQKGTPANLRLGIMIGAALLLGAVSVYVNTSSSPPSSTITPGAAFPHDQVGAIPGTPATLSAGTTNPPVVAGTPPLNAGSGTSSPVAGVASTPPSPFRPDSQTTSASSTTIQGAPGKASMPSADGQPGAVIPDVFTAAQSDAASGGRTGGTTPQSVSVAIRTPATLPGVPLSAVAQSVPVAAAVPLSLQTAPPVPPVPVRMAALPAPLPPVQQLRPLPEPITAGPTANSPVILTRPGVNTPSQPAQATRGTVTLVGVADGDTPTAILDTPAGQLMAAAGDTVDVQGVPYTLLAIRGSTVILIHAQDRLILTETP